MGVESQPNFIKGTAIKRMMRGGTVLRKNQKLFSVLAEADDTWPILCICHKKKGAATPVTPVAASPPAQPSPEDVKRFMKKFMKLGVAKHQLEFTLFEAACGDLSLAEMLLG